MIWEKRGNFHNVTEAIKANSRLKLSDVAFPSVVSPGSIIGIEESAENITQALKDKTKITIVGDYDADGITAAAILCLMLRYLGTNPDVRLPKRYSEGYGLSGNIVDEIDEGLVLTVDNGIAAYDEIKKAKTKGLSIIVLDHHLPGEHLPPADILVNPHIAPNENGFVDYCGAGLAYMLACSLIDDSDFLKKMNALAAIGTVADVVPLVGDNRTIVREGIKYINHKEVPVGLLALLRVSGHETVDEQIIGFVIGPLLNAAGRLLDNGAMVSLEVLITENYDEAEKKAYALAELNKKRKELLREGMDRAHELLKENKEIVQAPICIHDPELVAGIAGLVAGRLSEEFNMPALVLTGPDEEGVLKGSGRSCGGIHLKHLLDEAKRYLLSYGGHEGAVGLSLLQSEFWDFKKFLEARLADFAPDAGDILLYDLDVGIDEIPDVLRDVLRYAPYGECNPRPIIRVDNIILLPKGGSTYKTMGENDEHIRLMAKGLSIVAFNGASDFKALGEVQSLNVVGYLSQSTFMGRTRIELEAIDFTGNTNKIGESVLQQNLLKSCLEFRNVTGGE